MKQTIKVLPAGGTSFRNRAAEIVKQNIADNVIGYAADHSDHDGPGNEFNEIIRGRFKEIDPVQEYYIAGP